MMRKTGIPSGIAELGYTDADIPRMAAAAFAQKRPLAQAPLEITENDLAEIYRGAMRYW
jgi:alcohol dehydrogenase class IV